jgi:hypothetical protein
MIENQPFMIFYPIVINEGTGTSIQKIAVERRIILVKPTNHSSIYRDYLMTKKERGCE